MKFVFIKATRPLPESILFITGGPSVSSGVAYLGVPFDRFGARNPNHNTLFNNLDVSFFGVPYGAKTGNFKTATIGLDHQATQQAQVSPAIKVGAYNGAPLYVLSGLTGQNSASIFNSLDVAMFGVPLATALGVFTTGQVTADPEVVVPEFVNPVMKSGASWGMPFLTLSADSELTVDEFNSLDYGNYGYPFGTGVGASSGSGVNNYPSQSLTEESILNVDGSGAITSGLRADSFAQYLTLALPMNGANNGTTFTDVSPENRTSSSKTVTGTAKTVTSESKRYGSSAYFDGSSYLTVGGTQDFAFGQDDFTVEFWIKCETQQADNTIVGFRTPGSSSGLSIVLGGKNRTTAGTLRVTGIAEGSVQSVTRIGDNLTWYHCAVTREAGSLKIYINGYLEATATDGFSYSSHASRPIIGADDFSVTPNSGFFRGWIQDLRIYTGLAKYAVDPTHSGSGTARSLGILGSVTNPTLGGTAAQWTSDSFSYRLIDGYMQLSLSLNTSQAGSINTLGSGYYEIPLPSGWGFSAELQQPTNLSTGVNIPLESAGSQIGTGTWANGSGSGAFTAHRGPRGIMFRATSGANSRWFASNWVGTTITVLTINMTASIPVTRI